MAFPIVDLLVYVSRMMTLEPGDVMLTGTPAGVGPLADGDRVEVEVSGVGVLANPVEALRGSRLKLRPADRSAPGEERQRRRAAAGAPRRRRRTPRRAAPARPRRAGQREGGADVGERIGVKLSRRSPGQQAILQP